MSSNTTINTFLQALPDLDYEREVNIDRNNIFESLYNHYQSHSDFFNRKIFVRYLADSGGTQAGIDAGGLTKDLFGILGQQISCEAVNEDGYDKDKCFFVGGNKENKYYFKLNHENKNLDKWKFLGKLFAFAIKSGQNIDIHLHPTILYMLAKSYYGSLDTLENTDEYKLLSKYHDKFTSNETGVILTEADKSHRYSDRKIRDFDTWQKIKNIIQSYDCSLLKDENLNFFLKIAEYDETKWNEKKAEEVINCFDGDDDTRGFICWDFFPGKNLFEYQDKDEFIYLILKGFFYSQYKYQIENFLRGFHNIINPLMIPSNLSLKDLNLLIQGNNNINLDTLLENMTFTNYYSNTYYEEFNKVIVAFKKFIKKEYSKDNTYLNDLLQWMTGSRNIPANNIIELKFYFLNILDIKPHTCFNRIDIPYTIQNNIVNSFESDIVKSIKLCNNTPNNSEKILELFLSQEALKSQIMAQFSIAGGNYMVPLKYEYN